MTAIDAARTAPMIRLRAMVRRRRPVIQLRSVLTRGAAELLTHGFPNVSRGGLSAVVQPPQTMFSPFGCTLRASIAGMLGCYCAGWRGPVQIPAGWNCDAGVGDGDGAGRQFVGGVA